MEKGLRVAVYRGPLDAVLSPYSSSSLSSFIESFSPQTLLLVYFTRSSPPPSAPTALNDSPMLMDREHQGQRELPNFEELVKVLKVSNKPPPWTQEEKHQLEVPRVSHKPLPWTQEEKRQLWEHALRSEHRVPWKKTENELCKVIPGRTLMACQLYYQVHYCELRDLFKNQYVSDNLRRKSKTYSC